MKKSMKDLDKFIVKINKERENKQRLGLNTLE